MNHERTEERQKYLMENGGVECPICNLFFKSLGNHVYKSHKITAIDFRRSYGMYRKEKLTCEEKRNKFVNNAKINLLSNRGPGVSCIDMEKKKYFVGKDIARRKVGGKLVSDNFRTPKKVQCVKGHLFTEENLIINKKTGKRKCRTCYLKWRKAYYRAKKELS